MIAFKTEQEKTELQKLDARVRLILLAIAGIAWLGKKYHVIVTDCLRSKEEDEKFGGVGIHPSGRAVDFNFCDDELHRVFDGEYAARLEEIVNAHFPYDGRGKYRTLIHHDIGAGMHFHLQVNPIGKTVVTK